MKYFLIALVVVTGVSATLAGTIFLVRQHRQGAAARRQIAEGPANLAREEAAARREGIPLTAQELQRPLPPPGENAAPLYVALTKLLHDKPLGLPKYAEGMDAFHTYTPAQIIFVRRTLAARQDVMTLVHQAADKPQCVFVRDWSQGPSLMLPEYQPMRQAVRLLKTESYLMARDGHYQEAVGNQARGFQIARHAASEPILISYFLGNACELITIAGMQSILAQAGPNAGLSQQIQSTIRHSFASLPLRGALVNESAMMAVVFQQLHAGQHQGIAWLDTSLSDLTSGKDIDTDPQHTVPPVSAAEQKIISDVIDAQHASYLADVRRLSAALRLPVSKRQVVYASLLDPSAPSARNGARLFSFLFLSDGRRLEGDAVRLKAREIITLAAAAVLAAKAEHHTYPSQLSPVFLDPFTDKPLAYRHEGADGFIVYSTGPTTTFSGGKPGAKVPPGESEFRYPSVPLPITTNMLK